jgi:hypothetical protein
VNNSSDRSVWSQEFQSLVVSRFIELGAITIVGTLIFPLLPVPAIIMLVILTALMLVRLKKRFSLKFVAGVVCVFLVAAIMNIGLLIDTSRTKFVVPTDSFLNAVVINEWPGPTGPFLIVPASPPKQWLFRLLSRYDHSFIILDTARTADGYIVVSPSELALARLSAPDGINRRRLLTIPFLRREAVVRLRHNELSFSLGAGGGQMTLITDVGPDRPGLFGVRSDQAPSIEAWRRVAYGDELIRNLHRLTVPDLIADLEREGARTGDLRDFMRLLVFRLKLVPTLLGASAQQPLEDSIFRVSTLGNLRWVAQQFEARNPRTSLVDDPWGWSFQQALIEYPAYLPRDMAQSARYRVETGEAWIARQLARSAEVLESETFTQNRGKPERTGSDADDRLGDRLRLLIERMEAGAPAQEAANEMFAIMARASGADPDPLAEGDARRLLAFTNAGGALLRPEVRRWINADPVRAPSRGYLIYGAIRDRCAAPMREMQQFIAQAARGGLVQFERLARRLESNCVELPMAADILPTGLQRQIMSDQAARDWAVMIMIRGGAERIRDCVNQPEAASTACAFAMLDWMSRLSRSPLAQAFIDWMRSDCGLTCGGNAFYARHRPVPGEPYSDQEFFYGLSLIAVVLDDRPAGPPEGVCRSVERDFSRLLEENRLFDRIAVLNLHFAIFQRCRSPHLAALNALLATKRLPVMGWHRYLPRAADFFARAPTAR